MYVHIRQKPVVFSYEVIISVSIVPRDRPQLQSEFDHAHTHTHSVLTAIFPGEPGLAGCPLNSPPFIRGLCILLGQA